MSQNINRLILKANELGNVTFATMSADSLEKHIIPHHQTPHPLQCVQNDVIRGCFLKNGAVESLRK